MIKESSFQGSNSKLFCMKYVHSVIAGLLGCRWYTYQQSININGKRDVFSFWLIWCTFLLTILYFYFWLVVGYDCNLISQAFFLIFGYPFPWYPISSILLTAALIYVSSIMILCVLHLMLNKEMFIHPLHWTILSFLIAVYFVVTVFILAYLSQLFTVTYLSLKIFGPYIHIICVTFFTTFSWIFYKRWFMLVGKVEKTVWMTLWVFTLMILYSTPLLMESHISKTGVLKKPGIIAVGGASDIAPENTLLAFKKAIDLGAEGLYLSIQFRALSPPSRSSLVNSRTQGLVYDDLGMSEYVIYNENAISDGVDMKTKQRADILECLRSVLNTNYYGDLISHGPHITGKSYHATSYQGTLISDGPHITWTSYHMDLISQESHITGPHITWTSYHMDLISQESHITGPHITGPHIACPHSTGISMHILIVRGPHITWTSYHRKVLSRDLISRDLISHGPHTTETPYHMTLLSQESPITGPHIAWTSYRMDLISHGPHITGISYHGTSYHGTSYHMDLISQDLISQDLISYGPHITWTSYHRNLISRDLLSHGPHITWTSYHRNLISQDLISHGPHITWTSYHRNLISRDLISHGPHITGISYHRTSYHGTSYRMSS
ncbi:hypothetical protein Btru_038275 [Bulinus truncatus]|nr:hypothetical protein Btru_038275 [Bulinus truncatus]